jgi:2,5-diketo-D-gluconate reductase A
VLAPRQVAQEFNKWHLQQGRWAIPKSAKPQRIAENIDVLDFELATEELAAIDAALDTDQRGGPSPRRSRWRATGVPFPRTEVQRT